MERESVSESGVPSFSRYPKRAPTRRRSRRVPWAISLAALGVATIVAAGGMSSAATPSAPLKQWQPPYSTSPYHTDTASTSGCYTSHPKESMDPSTGVVSGTVQMSATSCASTSSTSTAVVSGEVAMVLSKFSGIAGKHPITVDWDVTAHVKLSLAGSGCSGASAFGELGAEASWADITTGGALRLGDIWAPTAVFVNTTTTGGFTESLKVHLTWNATGFVKKDTYAIYTEWYYKLGAAVLNAPYSCTANADLKPSAGTGVATLSLVTIT